MSRYPGRRELPTQRLDTKHDGVLENVSKRLQKYSAPVVLAASTNGCPAGFVIVTIVSLFGSFHLFMGRIQPTYIRVNNPFTKYQQDIPVALKFQEVGGVKPVGQPKQRAVASS